MSIEKRGDNKWRFRVRKNGQTYTTNFLGSEKDAKKAHQAFVADVGRDMIGANDNMRFEDFCELFTQEYVSTLSDGSKVRYRTAIRTFDAYLHGKAIGSIKQFDLQRVFNKLSTTEVNKHGSKIKSKLEPSYIANLFASLKCIFNKAVAWEVIKSNPCTGVNLPKVKKKKNGQICSADEIAKLIDILSGLDNITHKTYLMMSLFGGFRKGELIAITLDDIDWKENSITINKQCAIALVDGVIKERIKPNPKSDNSFRKVFLPDFVMDILREYVDCIPYTPMNKSVFWNFDDNKQYTRAHFNHTLTRILEDSQLPKLTPHKLRHLNGTMLINNGANIVSVAQSLGDTVETVSKVYVHEIEEVRKQDANRLKMYMKDLAQ